MLTTKLTAPIVWITLFVFLFAVMAVGTMTNAGESLRGDVNNDGVVGVVDAQLILQLSAGIIPALPTTIATPHPTPTLVIPTTTPTATPVRGGDPSHLSVPPDFSVNYSGCTRNGPPECIPDGAIAFYSIGTHEAVMPVGSTPGSEVEQHETCHAHEDFVASQAGGTYGDWPMLTAEGRSYVEAITSETGIWGFFSSLEDINSLESFAQMCAVWYKRPNDLFTSAPVTYRWFAEHLP
jgi:hypothetical protein